MLGPVIDPDAFMTWPAPVREFINKCADRLEDSTEYTGDLVIPYDEQDRLRPRPPWTSSPDARAVRPMSVADGTLVP